MTYPKDFKAAIERLREKYELSNEIQIRFDKDKYTYASEVYLSSPGRHIDVDPVSFREDDLLDALDSVDTLLMRYSSKPENILGETY